MLFDIEQFEQQIHERVLKQGLKLFKHNQVSTLSKQASTFQFVVANTEVWLSTKRNLLLSYSCSCNRPSFCEHLSAAIFFLQHEKFAGLAKSPRKKRKINPSHRIARFSQKQIADFFADKKNKTTPVIFLHIKNCNEEFYFDVCLQLLFAWLEPEKKLLKLEQKQIDSLLEKLNAFFVTMSGTKHSFVSEYYLNLALYVKLQEVLQWRFVGNEAALTQLNAHYQKDLDVFFEKGWNAHEKQAWQNALYACLKNNRVTRNGGYLFLLPRYLTTCDSSYDFWRISDLLKKRRTAKAPAMWFNGMVIAELELIFQKEILALGKTKTSVNEAEAEEIIALMELLFCKKQHKKAFVLAQTWFNNNAQKNNFLSLNFLDYALEKAHYYQDDEAKRHFIYHRMVFAVHITESDFELWLQLTPFEVYEKEITTLIKELKQSKQYSFSKLALVLQKTERWEELIVEIKHQDNAFRLLHDVVIRKLPLFDTALLDLYTKHFVSALKTLQHYYRQQDLFKLADQYIHRLPADAREYLLDKIITSFGSRSQLSKYFETYYE